MSTTSNLGIQYNPDILNTLSNLSNDEVFTPPELVNQMLDLLPQELWSDKNATFLDPATKSGVFLREITKRLIKGLENDFPNLEKRLEHIFNHQLYGIAITQITSLIARRSLYCSKFANSKYSVVRTKTIDGNIRFKKIDHSWIGEKCIHCGASKKEYKRNPELESHAYEFIHTKKVEDLFNMKFDVIIGNPPYQLSVGNTSGNSSKATAIYHKFIDQAKKLNPRFICMIVPSRWMTRSAEGVSDDWINEMINDSRIRIIHDFEASDMCFPGVEIKGGVNYFLWERDYSGVCDYYLHSKENQNLLKRSDYLDSLKSGIIIRDPKAHSILNKIRDVDGDYFLDAKRNFSSMVSPKDFFTNKESLTSSWNNYDLKKSHNNNIKIYLNKNIHKIDSAWVSLNQIPKNIESVKKIKVYIPAAGGTGNDDLVLGMPFVGEENSVCSQTYLVIGYDPINHGLTLIEAENIVKYIKTRFFRYLVSIKKKTQNGPRGVYQFVPILDFNYSWDDNKLFERYNLSVDERLYIESMVKSLDEGK